MNKVWTYLSSKELTDAEVVDLTRAGLAFVNQWTAHENKLKADFQIFKNRILVFTVDEDVHNASGCSIDKLLRFVKTAELEFGIQLLNRLLVAVDKGNKIAAIPSSKISDLLQSGELTQNSLVYNTAASNSDELATWQQELKDTWLRKYVTT
jgi:hypothetical protein